MSDATATVQTKNGTAAAKAYQRRAIAPPIDVFENVEELLLVADVPGVASDGIDLRIENDTLTLVARRAEAGREAAALAHEYEETDFATSFQIPQGIDATSISAETKNGMLVVHLPKTAATKSRKVVVRSNTGD